MIQFLIRFIILLIFIINFVTAQQIRIGAKAGLNYANASISELRAGITNSSTTKIIFGGIFNVPLSKTAEVQLEPSYTQKGTQINDPYLHGPPRTIIAQFDYLSLPLSAKFNIQLGSINPYLIAGTSIDFLLSSKYKYEVLREEYSEDVNDYFKTTDFSLDIGGGFQNEVTTDITFTADIRYSFGLMDIINKQGLPNGETSWKARDIKASIGIVFNFMN